MEKVIKRLAIFDFDGTLVDTPVPEIAKVKYESITGNKWPYEGFWSKKESLDVDMFDMPVIKSVARDYQQERDRDDTLLVMMTGRIKRLSKLVEGILASYGMTFDEYKYKHGAFGNDTIQFKIGTLDEYVAKLPHLESVAMWEDRTEHATEFSLWGKTLEHWKGIKFDITIIDSKRLD
jgi:hypothetical protein